MTNKEFFATCSEFELADTLTEMLVSTIEEITGTEISYEYRMLEFQSVVEFLRSEFIEPSKYLN